MKRGLEAKIAAAIARRFEMDVGPATDLLRLVHDEADGLPGLVVDAYGEVARLEVYDPVYLEHARALTRAVLEAWPPLRAAVLLFRLPGGRFGFRERVGDVPTSHVVREDGWRYLVRVADGQAAGTGIFVDHREGRRIVRRVSRGALVLNLFAHAGAFGVAAFAGGAKRIDHVDAAKKCAPWAATNLAMNGEDPRRHRFLVDDAFKVARRAARRGPTYGVIVCDPPTTAIGPKGGRFVAREALPMLAELSCRALLPGGSLLLSTNDRSLSVPDVAEAALQGAEAAGVGVARVEEIPLGPDLPKGRDPRTRPMRGVWLVLKDA